MHSAQRDDVETSRDEGDETIDGANRANGEAHPAARSPEAPDETTIDGANRTNGEAPPVSQSPEAADYPELAIVERRHYVIRGEIAKGGMGRVLEARDLRLGRSVAIKELLPKNRDFARRLEREARITARLQHPAIINVYEAGVWPGGEPFYAMTKVTGRSLAQVVSERKTLEQRIGLLPNVIAVADALAYAHSQDVIHRDLKPSNVLVGGFGETVVIDWGLAKDLAATADPAMSLEMRARPAEQTLSGSIVGTPAYMPPEQARGEPVDHRADVYALGALLYKVLVGSAPYGAATSNEVLQQVLDGPPVPVDEREPGTPPDLVAIVNQAMARDPADRYPTAAELAADLKRFETGQLVAAHHYTRRQLIVRWLERHRVAVAISAFALTVFAVFGTLSVREIIAERDRAETEQLKDERRRATLLEERGRAELVDGRAGKALAYLAGAVRGKPTGALGFLLAEAMRPFEARLESVHAGEGAVLVAYRPDGTEFATASADGVITRWDAAGHRVGELDRGHGRARSLVWSPDGSLLAAAGDGDDHVVRVWSADGKLVHALRGHTGGIGDLSFSPDGKRLVSASADRTARLWDLETGSNQEIATYESAVTVAQFSPDGLRVITGSQGGAARVWSDIDTESEVRAHTAAIRVARWSPSGERVLTGSADGTARIWEPAADGMLAREVTAPIRHRDDVAIDDAAWSSDGTRVVTAGGDPFARVWLMPDDDDVGGSPRPIAAIEHADRVTHAQFSVDDRWIVTAGNDRVVHISGPKGQPIATFEPGDVESVALSRDGTSMVTGCGDGTAQIWELKRSITNQQRELSSPIHAIAVARDGRVAAGMHDTRVWLWRPDASKQELRKHIGSVFAVAFSADGRELVTAGEDEEVYVWTAGAEAPRLSLRVGAAPVRAVAFAPDRSTLVAGDHAGVLWIWSASGSLIAKAAGAAIDALAVDPHGTVIATATAQGVDLWSLGGERIFSFPTMTPVRALAFDARGEHLAIAGTRDTVIARFANNRLTPVLALEGPMGEVASVVFGGDGSLVFTGDSDGKVRVWDAAKGKLLATRDTGGEAIEALALSEDEWLWIGNADGIARALDVHVLRDPSVLQQFIERYVPWRLGDDDVVRRAK